MNYQLQQHSLLSKTHSLFQSQLFKLHCYSQIKMQFSVFSTGFLVAILAGSALASPANLQEKYRVSSQVQTENSCSEEFYRANHAGKTGTAVTAARPRGRGKRALSLTISLALTPTFIAYCSDEGITLARCVSYNGRALVRHH
jgi:hypothetical protein